MDNEVAWGFILILSTFVIMKIIITFDEHRRRKKSMRPIMAFNILINNKNFNFMSIVSSINLTSLAPVTLKMSVVDANNNNAVIPGTLSGMAFTSADPGQDVAANNAADPNSVDVHAVVDSGGTNVTATCQFTSTAVNTDGTPKVTGKFSAVLVVVNNIVVTVLNPVLVFNQN